MNPTRRLLSTGPNVSPAPFPPLPPRAAYLTLSNPTRRNALSLRVLQSLKSQLLTYNTSPIDHTPKFLPPFHPSLFSKVKFSPAHRWLVDAETWSAHRTGLPQVLVLRSSPGPVFCSGHDLSELASLSPDEVRETFRLCGEVMGLIRRCPIPVIGVIGGLATAAGCQLAMSVDLAVAVKGQGFKLPGAGLGLPCSSPVTAVSRRMGNGFAYRMLALAEMVKVEDLPGGVVEVVEDGDKLEERVREMVEFLASAAPRPQALAKWAFWAQVELDGVEGGGDGYEDAVQWAGDIMTVHAKTEEAREGMAAFREKRRPNWKL